MRNLTLWPAILVVAACAQPTREELLDAQIERDEQCREMLEELEENRDRPLIRATLQENYNRTCLGADYPDTQQ